jgi:hypothetical protein
MRAAPQPIPPTAGENSICGDPLRRAIASRSPRSDFIGGAATFALPFLATGVINRHAPDAAQKGLTTMTNAEATTPENAATVAEQSAPVAPEKASSKKGASPKKGAPKGQKSAKAAKAKAAPNKEAKAGKKAAKPAPGKEGSAPRAESRGARILELIGRPKGATLTEIQKVTDWRAHYADVRIMPTCIGNPVCGAGIAAMESA